MRIMTISAILLAATVAVSGCVAPWNRIKQLEQENDKLKASLDQTNRQLERTRAQIDKLDAAISQYEQTVTELTKQNSKLESDRIELRKQLDFCETQLREIKVEADRYRASALKHEADVKLLAERLKNARDAVKESKQRMHDILEQTTTGTQPAK